MLKRALPTISCAYPISAMFTQTLTLEVNSMEIIPGTTGRTRFRGCVP